MAAELTQKQETFCQKVVCEGLTQADAYRSVYAVEGLEHKALIKRASDLARSEAVAARIMKLRADQQALALKKGSYDLAQALKDADEALEFAKQSGSAAAVVAATSHKAKLAGLMVERKEIRQGPLDETDIATLTALRDELERRRASEEGKVFRPVGDVNRPETRAAVH